MRVHQISIENHRYDTAAAVHSAAVVMRAEDGYRTSFLCEIPDTGDIDQAALDAALLDDAIRQARRMPEIRSGREPLDLGPYG